MCVSVAALIWSATPGVSERTAGSISVYMQAFSAITNCCSASSPWLLTAIMGWMPGLA